MGPVDESTQLQRQAYAATPRTLDPALERLARGDRGCLPDTLAGLGALSMFGALVLAGLGLSSFAWAYAGAALWVGGFFYGAWVQAKSGKVRHAALTEAPLVLGHVLFAQPHLRKKGKRPGRAVVLFSTQEDKRFEPGILERFARDASEDPGALGEGKTLLADPHSYGVFPVGPAESKTWAATVLLHPERLEGGRLAEDQPVVLFADPGRDVVEQAPLPPQPPEKAD